MPKVTFEEKNIKKNDYDYPKIKLEKNEIARVVLLEDPEVEYVHNLRKPKLNGGVPEKEIKTRFRDGSQYEDYVYEFVARPICLGDFSVLEQDGSDPKHCPICEEATRSDKFSAPQRRFSLHVLKYETVPGTTNVKEPYQATNLIWSFTDKVFTKLFALKQEWGDLRQHDLILKCENKPFQTYDISVAAKAEWMQGDDRQKATKAIRAKENLAPDLSIFCGSRKSETQIGYDIRAVNEAWSVALGTVSVSATDAALSSVGGSLDLASGIDDLLDSGSSTQETSTEDPWAPSGTTAPDAKRDDAAPFEESKSSATSELDDILNGL